MNTILILSKRILPLYRMQTSNHLIYPQNPPKLKVAIWTIKLEQRFSTLAFCTGSFFVLCELSCVLQDIQQHNIPDPYPLDAGNPPSPVVTNENVFRHCHMSPGRQNHPWLSSTELNGLGTFSGSTHNRNLLITCLFHIPLVVFIHLFICLTFIEVHSIRTKY